MISIVIPSTRSEKLKACLASIEAGSVQPNDVIVVEDKKRLGPAWARNQGIAKVKSKYTLVLDDDTCLGKNALREFVEHADYADKYYGNPVAFYGRVEPKEPCTPFQSFLHGHGPHFLVPEVPYDAGYIVCHPSHMVFPTELLQCEKYNESFVYPRLEDRELGWRLQEKHKLEFHYDSAAIVIHDHRVTLLEWLKLQPDHAKAALHMVDLHNGDKILCRDAGIDRAEGLKGYSRLALEAAISIVRSHEMWHPEEIFGSKFTKESLFGAFCFLAEFVRIHEIRRLLGQKIWGGWGSDSWGAAEQFSDVTEYILGRLS